MQTIVFSLSNQKISGDGVQLKLMNYLVVCKPQSYAVTKETGVIGYYDELINRSGTDFKNVKRGDKVFFYVSGKKTIEGVAQVTESYFFDNAMVYGTDKNYVYPHRIRVQMQQDGLAIDFKKLVPQLELIKDKSGRVVYSAYFVRAFIALSEADSDLLEKVTSKKIAVA